MIVAITGSIGSGKTSVAKYLARLANAEYCNTDLVCKELLEAGQAGLKGVIEKWGDRFLDETHQIDRSFLRQTIFDDPSIRSGLEDILHPLVRDHVNRLKENASASDRLLIVEVPLLFEVGWQNDFDKVITVYASDEECLKRVQERDCVSLDQATKAMQSQFSIEKKIQLSDFVVDNSGGWDQTCDKIKKLYHQLQKFISYKDTSHFTSENT